MEMAYVLVDVSKDRVDVHVLPEGETFVVAREPVLFVRVFGGREFGGGDAQ